jgi:hypothetical protein
LPKLRPNSLGFAQLGDGYTARRMTDITDEQIDAALKRGEHLARTEPRASRVRYRPASGTIVVDLTNGCTFTFPARALQGLADATDAQLAQVEVLGAGIGLHWEDLDADFTVPGLLVGLFGTRHWLREQARRAGSATSPSKAAAARANGRKGGRPKATVG